MDPLSDMLAASRPQSHRAAVLDLGERCSLSFDGQDGALKCNAVLNGAMWIAVDGALPVRVRKGDFVLLPHGRRFSIYSYRDIPPVPATELVPGTTETSSIIVDGGGRTEVVSCRFDLRGAPASMLLAGLPAVIVVGQDSAEAAELSQLVTSQVGEQRCGEPGRELVLRHLSYLILIKTLRLVQSSDDPQPGWLPALRHPQLGRVLAALHERPGDDWTLMSLAQIAGMSRSNFARRFREHVGIAPIDYLTRWRMVLAADRLREGRKIAELARDLGYGSESAFGLAFKRVMRKSPRRYAKEDRTSTSSPSE